MPETSILVESKDKEVPWWLPMPHFPQATRDLIRKYAGIDGDKVDAHIASFRVEAWNIRPYPCVGMWAFLKPVTQWAQFDNEYGAILERVKDGDSILDVGCAMAQDLRRLAADGAPTHNMCAADITPEFWDASFHLFRDRATLQAQFFCSDIFDSKSALARHKSNSFDIIICGDFFHLFDWDHQVDAGTRIVALGRAQAGTMIIGKQIGSSPGKHITTGWGKKDVMYFHDEQTFRQMWSDVQAKTDSRWDIKVRVAAFGEGGFWSPKEDFQWMGSDRHGIQFIMTRL